MEWKPRKKINLYYKAKDGTRYYIWTWPWGPYVEDLAEILVKHCAKRKEKKVASNIPKYAEKRFRKMADDYEPDTLSYNTGWTFWKEDPAIYNHQEEINQYIKDELQIDGYTKRLEEDDYNGIWVIFEKGA